VEKSPPWVQFDGISGNSSLQQPTEQVNETVMRMQMNGGGHPGRVENLEEETLLSSPSLPDLSFSDERQPVDQRER